MIDFEYMTICLFALRVGKNSDDWRLAYGVVSPALEKMETLSVSGSTQLGSCENGKMSIRKVVWSGGCDDVLGIYDDLASGIGLKTTFENYGVDTTDLNFDMAYTQAGIVEPWGTENVTGCQKAYTKKITMLDPTELLVKDGKKAKDAEKGIRLIEDYLRKQTGLPFDERFDHVGNLEIVIVPDRDEAGHPLLELDWEKGAPFHQKVKVRKELMEAGDVLTINIICTENNRKVVDLLDRINVDDVEDVEKRYAIKECPDRINIKIWRQRGDDVIVLTDTMYYLLKSIHVSMGVMGAEMRVKTEWLDDIRKNLPKKKEKDLEEAETFDRTEREHFTIGEKITRRRARRIRIKGNDEFFPKGWDSVNEEQGMLSFLGWFKQKAQGAMRIFLQDPYFEDVAMYFIASADISSEYTVLTQTQLKTKPDGTSDKVKEGEERKRRSKIVEGIKLNPRMYAPMKLVVKDLPITHNTLHDRYLVFDYGERVEAYTLSNSLQGATNKQPLLVTQIGDNAFEKVSAHIAEVLKREDIETIYDYSAREDTKTLDAEKVADEGFYEWLVIQKEKLLKGDVEQILSDIFSWKTYEKLSTLGYFLASKVDDEEALDILESLAKGMAYDGRWVGVLKYFLLKGHYTEYPIGYIHCPFRSLIQADLTPMMGMKYEKIVTSFNTHLLDYVGCDGHTFGVYGQYYVAKLLLKLSVSEYVDVLKQLEPTLNSIKTDKTQEPCYKVAAMMMAEMAETDIWTKSDSVMKALLADPAEWCRGIGALMLLHRAQDDDFKCEDYRGLFNNDNEVVTICHAAWGMKPAAAHQDVFYGWLREAFLKMGDAAYFKKLLIEEILGETHFLEDKVDYMKNVVNPLIAAGFVDKGELSQMMTERLFEKCVNGDHAVMMAGVLPECLYAIDGNLDFLYDQAKKEKEAFEKDIKSIVAKDRDSMFFASKRCIELRLVLLWLVRRYKKTENKTVDDLNELLNEIDKMLDDYGFGETKKMFEANVITPIE